MRYKSFCSPSVDPYYNLALERFLTKYIEPETAVLYLWQNDDTIVIGKNQDLRAECSADEFEADGGRIARRRSGGGAVYQDLGTLCVSVLTQKGTGKDAYRELLYRTIDRLGVGDVGGSGNDLTLQGKKVSGSAFYEDGSALISHGTVLVDCDIARMTHYLTPSAEKLRRHAVQSVSARVMNLASIDPSLDVMKLIRSFLEVSAAEEFSPDLSDASLLRYEADFRSRAWIYGINQ